MPTHSSLIHPFSELGKPESDFVNVVKAEGSVLTDDTGKQYLDGMASANRATLLFE